GQWTFASLRINTIGGAQKQQGGVDGSARVRLGVGILEDGHESVTGRLIDVAAPLVDTVEERREVTFDQRVQRLWRQSLAHVGVAGDVEKEDGDVPVPLRQPWGLGVRQDETLYRLRNELGEVVLDPRELADLAIDGGLEPERRLNARHQLA